MSDDDEEQWRFIRMMLNGDLDGDYFLKMITFGTRERGRAHLY